ncbi:Glucose/ribitol dehydrogenase [Penicillium soppii]|uniref:Glucose/ribitol dehydrogenase n=1 Tax=Penicillium soppii TaxID=69789 RepID=UPI002547658B|nr:Glucose/ribitol dehydrogenase [Penicillium soppii]KAJ5860260.1 Glucose/ribitol dehydrogenase [Penicillium soppii]
MNKIGPTNAFAHAGFIGNIPHSDTYPAITPTGSELKGRSIFITGASKGIGRATAISCVKAGVSKIAIAARSSPALQELAQDLEAEAVKSNIPKPLILALEVDVTSKESVKAAAEKVKLGFEGVLDILVNNAGYMADMKTRIGDIDNDPDDWAKGWDVNIKGPYLCCHYLLPMLLVSELKTVINITSIGAHCVSVSGSGYNTSRFALCRFTETLAREYEKEGLVAISLHPGTVATDMADQLPDYIQELSKNSSADKPALPADTIVWLSKEKRDWLTGRFVFGNWDMEELKKREDDLKDNADLLKFRLTL